MPIAEWEQEYADLKTQRDSDYTKLKEMCIRDRDRYEQMSQKYSEEYYALKAELATLQEQLLSLIHI